MLGSRLTGEHCEVITYHLLCSWWILLLCGWQTLFFSLLFLLPDCAMHGRFSQAISVTQYLFILCLARWHDTAAPSVYRTDQAYNNVWTVAALCSSWLESAEPLRKVTSSVRIKLDDQTLDVDIMCTACPTLRLTPKGLNPVLPGNNVHDTFPTGTWPGTTYLSGNVYTCRVRMGRKMFCFCRVLKLAKICP
jgi:hypothetical protein